MEITRDGSGAIVLSGQMVVSAIEGIHSQLESILEEVSQEIVLDLAGVTEIDTSGLQLLYAIWKSFVQGGSVRFASVSPPVKEALALSGFDLVFREVV